MKKLFLLIPILLFVASLAGAQGPPKEEFCTPQDVADGLCTLADTNDHKALKIEINSLIDEMEQLLHTQKEWNNGSANQHISHLNVKITNFTEKLLAAKNDSAVDYWQDKLDKVEEQKAIWEDTSLGSPRDVASKLGPQIAALLQQINDLKQELNSLPYPI